MYIGIGARLVISTEATSASKVNDDAWARACCSLYLLDCTYGSGFRMPNTFPSEYALPMYTQRLQTPFSDGDGRGTTSMQSFRAGKSTTADIETCYAMIACVWTHTMVFLRHVKDSENFEAWAGNSPYQNVVQELYKFERRMGDAHRVRDLRPDNLSSHDLGKNRGYWSLWLSLQILYHAIQAVLHHPFLHLARPQKEKDFRPPTFLQHTIDQVLLHSGWTIKLINLSVEKHIVADDPFLAYIVGIVATCYMFFTKTPDPGLSEEAQQNFATCFDFVESCAKRWPHLENTVSKLPKSDQSILKVRLI